MEDRGNIIIEGSDMKKSKIMEERIRRVNILFQELEFSIRDSEYDETTYTASFEANDGFQGGIFIDKKSKFLEISFTFFFPISMSDFLKQKLEDMLKICYEFGCYLNLDKTSTEIYFSIFTKLYYSGLNYYSLKQSVMDFRNCVNELKTLIKIIS